VDTIHFLNYAQTTVFSEKVGLDAAWDVAAKMSRGNMCQVMPMGRIGDCEADIGCAAVSLASTDANYITGQTINVDGKIWIAP